MTEQRAFTHGPAWLLAVALAGWVASQGAAQPLPPHPSPAAAGAPRANPTSALGLEELVRLSLDQNPSLRQAGLEIDAAKGRAFQAGLYPNPTVSAIGEEIGRQGGIHTLPQISQEIVTAGKLGLSRSVAERDVDQAHLMLMRSRYALLTTVRQGYFEVLAIQRRLEILNELVGLATKSYENAQRLLEAKQLRLRLKSDARFRK